MLPRTADIVIIGAGVIGAAIAYHLSRENIRAVVLEKQEAGGGSSGACEGLLLMQSKKPGIHPIFLTIGFLQAARKAGVTVFTHTRVRGIDLEHGRVAAVRTDKGRIATPIVINAAGSWAVQIGELVGLTIPIIPRRGQVLVTEAVAPLLSRCILSAKYIAAKFDPRIIVFLAGFRSVERVAEYSLIYNPIRPGI